MKNNESFEVKCYLNRIIYYKEETMWGVAIMATTEDLPFSAPTVYDFFEEKDVNLFKIAGKMQALTDGVSYIVRATSKDDDRYGLNGITCDVEEIRTVKEYDEHSSRKFLSSIITQSQVDSLMETYPNVVNDVINNPEYLPDLKKVKGIKEYTFNAIKNKILDSYKMSDFILGLSDYGISMNMIAKLYKQEGSYELVEAKLKRDPYIVTMIDGVGFKKADKFALAIKPELITSKRRCMAAMEYVLEQLANEDGDTLISISDFATILSDYVPECREIYKQIVSEQIELEIAEPKKCLLHVDLDAGEVGLYKNYSTENKIWQKLCKMQNQPTIWDIDIKSRVDQLEKEGGFQYTEEQRHFIEGVNKNNVNVLVGRAGSGKTWTLKGVYEAYKDKRIASCALSAKAARRIVESTGLEGASTIHRLLEYNDSHGFEVNESNQLGVDILVLDEAGMVNIDLIWSLVRALPKESKIIIVGDTGQLPPIGAGSFLRDINNKQLFHKVELTKIHRQAQKSAIITDANNIRDGYSPINEFSAKEVHGELEDMFYGFRAEKDQVFSTAVNTYRMLIKQGISPNDIIIVTPMKEGVNSVSNFNAIIQDYLLSDEEQYIENKVGKKFKLHDRVMQVKNNYDKGVMNGESGEVIQILYKESYNNGQSSKFAAGFVVEFPDYTNKENPKKLIEFSKGDMTDMELAYSATVHKLQGSGIPYVIVAMDTSHTIMLDRTLLYTAITRASKQCYLIAQPDAFLRAIGRNKVDSRATYFEKFINPAVNILYEGE